MKILELFSPLFPDKNFPVAAFEPPLRMGSGIILTLTMEGNYRCLRVNYAEHGRSTLKPLFITDSIALALTGFSEEVAKFIAE